MANNPYAEIDDVEAQPIAQVTAPEPIASDRGEPTTRLPKKRKTGVIVAVIAVITFTILGVAAIGFFVFNASSKRSAAAAVVVSDPALEPVSIVTENLDRFKDKVKLQEQQRLEAQAEEERAAAAAAAAADSGDAQSNVNATANTAPTNGPDRGKYASQNTAANGGGSGEKVLTPKEQAELRRLDGEVLWTGDGGRGGDSGASQRNAPLTAEERLRAMTQASMAGRQEGSAGGSSDSISSMLETESFANGSVVARPDLKFLLINGTAIPCTLMPRIVTDYPADTRCQINRDVYSANGTVLLMGKGSIARGERKVALKQGQSTVFVTWSHIETTDGLTISIDSMAADNLGAAGINAIIDNHYGQRFGGAILLSFLDDAFEAVAQNSSNSEGMNFDNSTQNAQDMSAIALENSIHIPPTGYVEHAKELNIIVARDIDFRSIYGVN